MLRTGRFTAEMGARLRQIRRERGLTLDTVAERMGMAGKGRHNLLIRLEMGRVKDPRLTTLDAYLRACGARWSDVTDLLDKTQHVPVTEADAARVREIIEGRQPPTADRLPPDSPHPDPLLREEREMTRGQQQAAEDVIRKAEQDTSKFARRIARPRAGRGFDPRVQRKAAEGYLRYTLQDRTIRRRVLEYVSRIPLDEILWPAYRILAEKFHKALRRAAREKTPERQAARLAQGMTEADAFLLGRRLDPKHVEAVRGIVRVILEKWNADATTIHR